MRIMTYGTNVSISSVRRRGRRADLVGARRELGHGELEILQGVRRSVSDVKVEKKNSSFTDLVDLAQRSLVSLPEARARELARSRDRLEQSAHVGLGREVLDRYESSLREIAPRHHLSGWTRASARLSAEQATADKHRRRLCSRGRLGQQMSEDEADICAHWWD